MLPKLHLVVLALSLSSAVLAAENGIVFDKNRVMDGRADLSDMFGKASAAKKEAARAAARARGRDDICLDYAGDVLTWGQVEDYVDLQLLESPLNIPPQATLDQINKIVASSKIRLSELAINTYLREALMVPLAREAGLTVSDEELTQALDRATAKASRKKNGAEIVPKLREPNSYFSRYQRNYLLSRKYHDSVLTRDLDVSPEEIASCISNRASVIAAAIATNEVKRATIEGFLRKIRAGELDFGETAYEYSDCGSSMENGDWGEFERDCTLLKPLKDFIFAPSTAEMSEIIETPFSYHIVKILERHYDAEDATDADADDTDDQPAPPPPAAATSRRIALAVIVALAALFSAGILVWVPKQAAGRLTALLPVWGLALLAAALAFKFTAGDGPLPAPTRVHVAHIMLEKEPVPSPLDEAEARAEVSRQKLAQRTLALQEQLLETAQTNGTLTCAVRVTLLNKVKLTRKKQKEKELNHEK